MNPVLGAIGNLLNGAGNNIVGSAQANGNMNNNMGKNGFGNIIGLYNMLRGKSDYMQTLQNMAQTNPQIKQGLDYVNQNGGNMKDAFYKLAEQNGINPNEILNMLK